MSHFKIVGPHEIGGQEPGETVEIADKAHAKYLVAAGHLEPANKSKKETAPAVAENKEK